MSTSITGKNAIVTGASKGIGLEVARALVSEGINILLCGRKEEALKKAAGELAGSAKDAKLSSFTADVSSSDDVKRLFEFADKELGTLDILVNNAGVGQFRAAGDLTVEEWDRMISTNLSGSFYCSREAIQRFRASKSGWIINVSSLAGKNPFAGGSAYNASKFGLNGFSEAMMLDHRNDNIRVSYIMPGSVDTEFGGQEAKKKSEWKIAPEDIGQIVVDIIKMPERTLISRVEVRPSRPPKGLILQDWIPRTIQLSSSRAVQKREAGSKGTVQALAAWLLHLVRNEQGQAGAPVAGREETKLRNSVGQVKGDYAYMGRLRKVLDPTKTGRDAESLEKTLLQLVVGQEEAVEQIVNIYQMHVTGLTAPGRPVGNFLFLGPTGSGKTRTVEATAEALLNNPRAVVKIDCAEFQHSHEIAKLIGSPPGYLGHRETHPLLSQEVINQHHTDTIKLSFILFDEIEKASDALWNLLLGILDKATLTLGDNKKVDFSRTLIFMTSNLGAAEMSNLIAPKLGFRAPVVPSETGEVDEELSGKLAKTGVEAARRKFTPEFMNRIDKVVVFKPLGQPDLRRILNLELAQVQQRIYQSPSQRSFAFSVSEAGKEFLLQEGTDMKYGARHLKRAIERLLVHPISNLIATDQVSAGDVISVGFDAERNCLVFTTEEEDMGLQRMNNALTNSYRTPANSGLVLSPLEQIRAASARGSKK